MNEYQKTEFNQFDYGRIGMRVIGEKGLIGSMVFNSEADLWKTKRAIDEYLKSNQSHNVGKRADTVCRENGSGEIGELADTGY